MEKAQWEQLIGHIIRCDTYLFLERMDNGEDYDNIKIDLENNREFYGIKKEYILTKEETIKKYQALRDGIKIDKKKKELKKPKLEKQQKIYAQKQNSSVNHGGIYGIYVDDNLIYIGKTKNAFATRFKQHRRALNHCVDINLYNYINNYRANKPNANIVLKPMVKAEGHHYHGGQPFSEAELEAMEYALIITLRPICNTQNWKQDWV